MQIKNTIMSKLANSILRFFFPILIISIIFIASCNHIIVNLGTQDIYSDIPALINNEDNSTSCTHDISEKIITLENLKKYHFDSNTVTLLISLIVTLLISIIIILQSEIRKVTDDYKEELQKYQEQIPLLRSSSDLCIRIESIYVETCMFKQSLLYNNETLRREMMEAIYSMYRKTQSVIYFIYNKQIKKIPKDIEWEIVATLDSAINNIDIEKIKANRANWGNTRYLEELHMKLIELKNTISVMERTNV